MGVDASSLFEISSLGDVSADVGEDRKSLFGEETESAPGETGEPLWGSNEVRPARRPSRLFLGDVGEVGVEAVGDVGEVIEPDLILPFCLSFG